MKSISAISLLAASLATPSVAHVGFQVDTIGCDGDPFYGLDLTVTCDGNKSPKCLFGDTASIDGTVEAVTSFSNSNVTIKACVWGYCPADNIRSAGSLCDDWLTPIDNQTCGEIGLYTVTGEEIIPEADITNSWSWLVKIIIGFEMECEAEATSYQQSVSYSMMGAIIGTVFGAAYAARKKLICAENDNEDERAGDFIEMSCPA